MKEKSVLLIAALIVLFSLGIFAYSYLDNYIVLGSRNIETKVKVISGQSAFNLTNSSFDFGVISSGSVITRILYFQNPYGHNVKVSFLKNGDISERLSLPLDSTVEGYEGRNYSFSFYAPSELNERNFSGNISMVLYQKRGCGNVFIAKLLFC
jgi:hypothetical protein